MSSLCPRQVFLTALRIKSLRRTPLEVCVGFEGYRGPSTTYDLSPAKHRTSLRMTELGWEHLGTAEDVPFKTCSGGSDNNYSFDAGPCLSRCCELCERTESRALPKCRDPSVRLSKHGR